MSKMAERNAEEEIRSHPDDIVSLTTQSSPPSLVQALIADQSSISMLSQAILSSIKADLSSAPTRAQDSNNTAEPVGQSVRIPAGESVDQRARGSKRTIPIEAIVVDQNAHAKRPRLTEDPSGDTSPYEHEAEDDEIEDDFDGLLSPNYITPAGRRAKN